MNEFSDETKLALELCRKDAEQKVAALAEKLLKVLPLPFPEDRPAHEHNRAVEALRDFRLREPTDD
jgi:hypothetical protein